MKELNNKELYFIEECLGEYSKYLRQLYLNSGNDFYSKKINEINKIKSRIFDIRHQEKSSIFTESEFSYLLFMISEDIKMDEMMIEGLSPDDEFRISNEKSMKKHNDIYNKIERMKIK